MSAELQLESQSELMGSCAVKCNIFHRLLERVASDISDGIDLDGSSISSDVLQGSPEIAAGPAAKFQPDSDSEMPELSAMWVQ